MFSSYRNVIFCKTITPRQVCWETNLPICRICTECGPIGITIKGWRILPASSAAISSAIDVRPCYLYQITGDARLKGKVDFVVSELALLLQARNGNGWVAHSGKYLDWVVRGEVIWARIYTIHKLFMGLIDAIHLLGNQQALDVAEQFAGWFTRWTAQFDEEKNAGYFRCRNRRYDGSFADLYALTGNPEHLTLMKNMSTAGCLTVFKGRRYSHKPTRQYDHS